MDVVEVPGAGRRAFHREEHGERADPDDSAIEVDIEQLAEPEPRAQRRAAPLKVDRNSLSANPSARLTAGERRACSRSRRRLAISLSRHGSVRGVALDGVGARCCIGRTLRLGWRVVGRAIGARSHLGFQQSPAPWRSGYAAACKAVYTGSIPVGAFAAEASLSRGVSVYRSLLSSGLCVPTVSRGNQEGRSGGPDADQGAVGHADRATPADARARRRGR